MPENDTHEEELAQQAADEAAEEAAPGGDEEPAGEAAEGAAPEAEAAPQQDDEDEIAAADEGLDDLMNIFSDESAVEEGGVGKLEEFLEELSMDQVAGEADRLLEEFRAI